MNTDLKCNSNIQIKNFVDTLTAMIAFLLYKIQPEFLLLPSLLDHVCANNAPNKAHCSIVQGVPQKSLFLKFL